MHLRSEEKVLRIVKRHYTPYLVKLFGIGIIAVPLYSILFVIKGDNAGEWIMWTFALISFFLGIIIALISLDYLLDKMVITNFRVISINWKSLFNKEEAETELHEIQDITTVEKGILNRIRFFDYGPIKLETAASRPTIYFEDCSHPGDVKHFILQTHQKNRGILNPDDRT